MEIRLLLSASIQALIVVPILSVVSGDFVAAGLVSQTHSFRENRMAARESRPNAFTIASPRASRFDKGAVMLSATDNQPPESKPDVPGQRTTDDKAVHAKDELKQMTEVATNARQEGGTILEQKISQAVAAGKVGKVRKLLEEGADPNTRNVAGGTLLMQAAFRGHKEVAQLLLDKGAQIDATCPSGVCVLATAAIGNHPEMVSFLVNKGAQVDSKCTSGSTALMMAAFTGYKKVLKALLDSGADINARNDVGATALMFAASFGHKEVVKLLMERGVDIHAKDDAGETALSKAEAEGYKEIAELLRGEARAPR